MYQEISNPMDYHVALYIRLSKEDESEGPSQSVTNQKSLLDEFVQKHRLQVYDTYIDDGWSGTNFDRPDFQRMIGDIEAKKVNMVITKDLSRLGRDYIMTGHYMERYFPEHRVRYISLLDGIDTGVESSANDITPFRAIMKNISHSGKVSNDFSLFRRFCCINRCFRCSCGKFAIVHGEQAAIGFRAAAIGEKRDPPETHPVQPRTESIRPCRSTRAKPASKELDRALFV